MTVFNLFVAYGDAFLIEANIYDYLYYEIIRHHETFEQLHSFGMRTCEPTLCLMCFAISSDPLPHMLSYCVVVYTSE